MLAALEQAKKAALSDEVPVGAVLVLDGKIIAEGHNLTIFNNDPTAHAEVVAIREACRIIGNYRLTQCELYVTLEPCCMCAGTIMQARLQKIYFGAYDDKSGVASSDLNLLMIGESIIKQYASEVLWLRIQRDCYNNFF